MKKEQNIPNRIDGRSLTPRELSNVRKNVVRLRKQGLSNLEVSAIVGLPPQTTSSYYSQWKKEGDAFFKVKSAGRPKGTRRKLSKEEEAHIVGLLIDKNPRQLQFPFALWTREAVQVLIERELGKKLPLSTVGEYLKHWQFTAKKPIKRAYERKDEKIKTWLKEEYPAIKEKAKKEAAEIWWADETACVSLPSYLRGYAPKGTHFKPVLEHPAKKFKINMISAVTSSGKSMFALYDKNINAERFIDFLERVIESSPKKVYLIVDNLRVHHAKTVREWVDKRSDRIALFFLPPYAPDHNPDEYLNQDLKRNANKDRIPKNIEELEENTRVFMETLQKNPERVAGYFKHPSVCYAA